MNKKRQMEKEHKMCSFAKFFFATLNDQWSKGVSVQKRKLNMKRSYLDKKNDNELEPIMKQQQT